MIFIFHFLFIFHHKNTLLFEIQAYTAHLFYTSILFLNINKALSTAMLELLTFAIEHKIITTLVIITTLLLLRVLVLKIIRGDHNFISEKQRQWMSRTKNGFAILIIITIFGIWNSEIKEFALSLTAIAMAVVIASKEMILCITGSIHRASSSSFTIGDWIEVGDLRGEVIEHTMLSTKIQEIDIAHNRYDYTGKTLTLPNSMFFSHTIKNMNFMKRYVYHNFTIVGPKERNLFSYHDELISNINDYSEEFIEVARRYNSVIERHAGVDLPGAEPHIHIGTNCTGESVMHITIFCPTEQAAELEQHITSDFMRLVYGP